MQVAYRILCTLILLTPSVLFAAPAREGRTSNAFSNGSDSAVPAPAEVLPEGPLVLRTVHGFLTRVAEVHPLRRHVAAEESSPSVLDRVPFLSTMQHRLGNRFNTTESSHVDAFALCYHLSDRLGVQVLPGNPTPPRMGASIRANNTGVTVGMILRLQRSR